MQIRVNYFWHYFANFTALRPPCLTSYKAESAAAISFAAVVELSTGIAEDTPMLTVTDVLLCEPGGTMTSDSILRRIASARSIAPRKLVTGRITANSSPP